MTSLIVIYCYCINNITYIAIANKPFIRDQIDICDKHNDDFKDRN